MKVAVVKEAGPGERRVALVPASVAKLRAAGHEVLVESGAGSGAFTSDESYAEAGACIIRADQLADCDVLVMVGPPDDQLMGRLRPGQVVIGLLAPLTDPGLAGQLAAAGVTAISLDLIPRTLSRAQPMDALTSQANIAGYKAALLAAATFGRFFPMLITAAGTARPAKVLVLGTGVAGLQAIGTARRLGAVTSAYDVRPETKAEVESLGGTFIELTSVGPAAGDGGYARALTDQERAAQQAELSAHIARHDVVITTAQVPGRRPPLLVTGDAVKAMASGSVIVDMAASTLGGNVDGSVPDQTILTGNGVTVIGAGNLPSTMAAAASSMYSRNVSSLLQYLTKDGELAIDLADDLAGGVVVTCDGAIVHPALRPPAESPSAPSTGRPAGSSSAAPSAPSAAPPSQPPDGASIPRPPAPAD